MKHLLRKKHTDAHAAARPTIRQHLASDGSVMSPQRQLGNGLMQQAVQGPLVQRACSCGGSCASCASQDEHDVQAKLTVGPANDRYEREADRVAQQVVGMSSAPAQSSQAPADSIQRMGDASGGTNASVSSLPMGESRPLSRATRQFMEPRFGADFSNVRVHSGPKSESTAQGIHARAFTHQNHIWLGKGASESDRSLMAHELTHVVQQGGRSGANLIQRAETDTSGNCASLQDSETDVNARVNLALSNARSGAGSPPAPAVVVNGVNNELATDTSIGRSAIEDWASTLPSTKQDLPSQASTKFRGVSFGIWSNPVFPILNPTMKVDGVCIGSDKLGHFFQQGFEYFEIIAQGGSRANAEEFGERTEGGGFGLATTGVFSNADLEANRQGLRFYNDLTANPAMTFDMSNYINANWNEESNPSFYESSVASSVWSNLLTRSSWSGGWDVSGTTTMPIQVSFTRKGSSVLGTYLYVDASGANINGKLSNIQFNFQTTSVRGRGIFGNTTRNPVSGVEISFDWSQGSLAGKGTWVSSNESTLNGTWGTGTSRTNGGSWNINS